VIHRYRYPIHFYVYSAVIPWVLWLIAAYLSRRPDASVYGYLISLLGVVGLSAPVGVALYYLRKDTALLADVAARFFNFAGSKTSYLIIASLVMPASILLAMAISLLLGYDASQFEVTGRVSFTSGVLPVWFLLAMAPLLEELAWHSYGTDCLRQKFNLFTTSILFAVYWVLWHVPLAFIQGYYHSNLVVEGALHSLNFVISIFPFVLLMNWLYYKTNRNILVAVVLHLCANVFNEIFAIHPDTKLIQTLLLLALTGFVIFKEREFFFTKDISQLSTEWVPSALIMSKQKTGM